MAKTPRTSPKKTTGAQPAPTAPFSGIPREAFTFFADLAAHNNKAWFDGHKAVFERACQAPLRALTAALDPPFGSEKLSRIYRDIRFSKDKSPYHTHLSTRIPGFGLWLSSEGLYVGTGLYMPDPPVLQRLRSAIDDDAPGTALARLVATLRKKGYTVQSHESVASVPRGFSAEHPRLELLRMKDIHAGRTLAPSELSSAKAVAAVRKVCADVAPVRQWLMTHVGPSACF